MDAQDAHTELQYWFGIISDSNETLADLDAINDNIALIVDVVGPMIVQSLEDSKMIEYAERILAIVKPMQDRLGTVIHRNEQTVTLITGRLVMLRSELGLE